MNLFNILASALSFLVGVGLLWGLWNPISTWIGDFDQNLRIFCMIAFFGICFTCIAFVPLMMLIGDDTGKI